MKAYLFLYLFKFFKKILPLFSIHILKIFAVKIALLAIMLNPKRLFIGIRNIRSRLEYDFLDSLKIIFESYYNLACTLIEFILIPNLSDKQIIKSCSVEGLEIFHEVLKQEDGVLLLTAHFGNWEFLGQFLVCKGLPLSSIAKTQKDKRIDKQINNIRASHGMEVITKGFGLREAISALKRNRIIGILNDQDAKDNGVFVDFLGTPASTPTTISKLNKKYSSPIVPVFIRRKELLKFEIKVYPALRTDDLSEKEILKCCNDITCENILDFPEQWLWMHNRWRTKKHF